MKRLILLILSVFILQTGKAQSDAYEYVPFPKSNATWSERYLYGQWDPDLYQAYETFTVNGEDTLINGRTYMKLFMNQQTSYNFFNEEVPVSSDSTSVYIGGLREENKKIWFWSDTTIHHSKPKETGQELLLYDFSLDVGDTVHVSTIEDNEEWPVIVRKIDTVQIGNTWRKKFFLQAKRALDSDSAYGYGERFEWIEGIGSLQGLLFLSPTTILTGEMAQPQNELVGFKSGDEIQYMNDRYDSFYPPVANETIEVPGKQIRVSQVDGYMKFSFDDIPMIYVRIFNMAGSLIESHSVRNQTEWVLQTRQMQSGIYMYQGIDKDRKAYTGKFVVR